MTHSTSKRLASSAIEMYVQRSVCGVVCASGGRPRAQPLGGLLRRVAHDLGHALARQPPAPAVRERVGLRVRRLARAAQPVEVRDELVDELGAHLHLAHAGLGLGVGMRNRAPPGSCSRTWPMRRSQSSLARMPLRASVPHTARRP